MISPKDKAEELVEKYRGVAHSDFHNQTGYDEAQREENQKQCALIAVDEILDDDVFDMSEELFEGRIQYWEKVKQEIEKL